MCYRSISYAPVDTKWRILFYYWPLNLFVAVKMVLVPAYRDALSCLCIWPVCVYVSESASVYSVLCLKILIKKDRITTVFSLKKQKQNQKRKKNKTFVHETID